MHLMNSMCNSQLISNNERKGRSQIKRTLQDTCLVYSHHRTTSITQTDFQYNHNGSQLAVADSDGYVFIYQRQTDNFVRTAAFKA